MAGFPPWPFSWPGWAAWSPFCPVGGWWAPRGDCCSKCSVRGETTDDDGGASGCWTSPCCPSWTWTSSARPAAARGGVVAAAALRWRCAAAPPWDRTPPTSPLGTWSAGVSGCLTQAAAVAPSRQHRTTAAAAWRRAAEAAAATTARLPFADWLAKRFGQRSEINIEGLWNCFTKMFNDSSASYLIMKTQINLNIISRTKWSWICFSSKVSLMVA